MVTTNSIEVVVILRLWYEVRAGKSDTVGIKEFL